MQLVAVDRNYINGEWVATSTLGWPGFKVIQPSDESVLGELALSDETAVDKAVIAAKQAFRSFGRSSKEDRLDILGRLIEAYQQRYDEMVFAMSSEMGAPITLSRNAQAAVGLGLLKSTRKTLEGYRFTEAHGDASICREPIGVAGMITPWNWPMNQVVSKVAAALAAGCTMVLKPSEYSPYSAALFAEIVDEAQVPPGVFNLIQGDLVAGEALSKHPDVDLISITGSTRAGIAVAIAAAPTVKRVTQELGGKSPYLVLPGADLQRAVKGCVKRVMLNSGQSCNAPTRLLVHESQYEEAAARAVEVASKERVGNPFDEGTSMGPLVNDKQYERVTAYIHTGIEEGAELLVGGADKPEGLEKGYYVQPTVFGRVDSDMRIAREEIFGPVLSILTYSDEEEAIEIANDTEYGLTAYVYAETREKGAEVAAQLRAGMVHVNEAQAGLSMPFGGYKMSGNGRERGEQGIEEYLEIKSLFV